METRPFERFAFSWGCGGYGRLGTGTCDEHSPAPLPVQGLQGVAIKSLTGGAAHCIATVVVESDSKQGDELCEVYTWGKCHVGQLGHGDEDLDQHVPKQIESLGRLRVDFVAAGASHVLLIAGHGSQTYTWGGGFHGCLGHGKEDHELCPRLVAALHNKGVVAAAGGTSHSVVVLRNGTVMGMGRGDQGQLGDTPGSKIPIEIHMPGPALSVAAGRNHTLFVQVDGNLCGCGSHSAGQLGLGSEADKNCRTPSVIDLGGRRAIKVACGELHSVVLVGVAAVHDGQAVVNGSTSITVLAAGSNRRGQLGYSIPEGNSIFAPMVMNMETQVADVSCGEFHTVVALASEPFVFTCGCSDYGKLGRRTQVEESQSCDGSLEKLLQGLADVGDDRMYTLEELQALHPYELKVLRRKLEVRKLFMRMNACGHPPYTLNALLAKSSSEIDDIRKEFESEFTLAPVDHIAELIKKLASRSGVSDFCVSSVVAGSNHTMIALSAVHSGEPLPL